MFAFEIKLYSQKIKFQIIKFERVEGNILKSKDIPKINLRQKKMRNLLIFNLKQKT